MLSQMMSFEFAAIFVYSIIQVPRANMYMGSVELINRKIAHVEGGISPQTAAWNTKGGMVDGVLPFSCFSFSFFPGGFVVFFVFFLFSSGASLGGFWTLRRYFANDMCYELVRRAGRKLPCAIVPKCPSEGFLVSVGAWCQGSCVEACCHSSTLSDEPNLKPTGGGVGFDSVLRQQPASCHGHVSGHRRSLACHAMAWRHAFLHYLHLCAFLDFLTSYACLSRAARRLVHSSLMPWVQHGLWASRRKCQSRQTKAFA